VVKTNIPNHTYPNAGIKLNGSNYILSDSADCTVNPKNGWCLFSGRNNRSHAFKVTKVQNVGLPVSQISFSLALNAVSQPVSTQNTTLFTNGSSDATSGRVIGYLYGWQTPPTASDIKAAGYTHVLLAFGLFSTTTPGEINIDSLSSFTDLAGYISDLKADGIKVLLSLGGASTTIANTTVDFDAAVAAATTPGDFETTFLAAMASLVTTYGFDGFDFDIEHGLYAASSFAAPDTGCSSSTYDQSCDISYLASIINTFYSNNSDKLITMAPQLANITATSSFTDIWGNYASLIMQTCASLEWVGFQNYNSGSIYGIDGIVYPVGSDTLTSSPDAAVVVATDLLEDWPQGTVNAFQPYTSCLTPSQVVIGYVVDNASGVSDGAPAVITSVAEQAIECLRTGTSCDNYTPPNTYPDIGGVFDWTINYDADNNYAFATALYPCVIQGNCTT
jgi:chitinase